MVVIDQTDGRTLATSSRDNVQADSGPAGVASASVSVGVVMVPAVMSPPHRWAARTALAKSGCRAMLWSIRRTITGESA